MKSCSSSNSCSPSNQTGHRTWRSRLMGRTGIILGLLIIAVGAAAYGGGWGWLVAVGVAPIILSILPCVVMCGLGLCMMKMGNKSATPSVQPLVQNNIDQRGAGPMEGELLPPPIPPAGSSFSNNQFS